MSRYFMIQSWVGSHENEPDFNEVAYNGQQAGERSVRSIETVPLYDQFGNANVSAFSDEAIAARNNVKKSSTVSIKNKILPQAKRLTTLQDQMIELEKEYKTTDMSIDEYTILRDVLVAKIQRQEFLYKKAISVKPKSEPEDDVEIQDDIPVSCEEFTPKTCANDKGDDRYSLEDFAWLSDRNSFKKILQKACKVVKRVVHYSQKAKSYWNELKAV